MNEKDLKLTDLDYAVGSHRLQMMKAALPYVGIAQQRILSIFIKWSELRRTAKFFRENDDGMLSVCALEAGHSSPADMLSAVRPYANEEEQEIIDLMTRVMAAGSSRSQRDPQPVGPEQLLAALPPEQRSRIEAVRIMMQAAGQD